MVFAVPAVYFVLALADDTEGRRAAAGLIASGLGGCLLFVICGCAADHRWQAETYQRALVRMLAISVGFLFVGMPVFVQVELFSESNILAPFFVVPGVLLILIAATATATWYLSEDRQPVPKERAGDAIDSQHQNAGPGDHRFWAGILGGLWLAASPIVWLLSAWCSTSILQTTVVVAAWTLVLAVGTIRAGFFLDHKVQDAGGTVLVIGRMLAASVPIFLIAAPVLLLLPPSRSCG